MKRIRKNLLHEHLVYVVLWAILFIAPLLGLYVHAQQANMEMFQWHDVFRVWRIMLVYLAVFLLHNFLLAPLLVYQHKRLPYFAGVVCLLAAFVLFQCQSDHHPKGMDNPPPIHETEFRPEIRDSQAHDDIIDFHGLDEHHGPEGHMGPPPHGNRMPMGGVLEKFFQFLMMVLALGMNLGVKLYFKYQQDQRELQALESRSLEQQLAYLKYQINPHFYMNTLNNIHALVDIDPEKAKDTILLLSKIMRYVLYEADKKMVPIGREVEFVKSYIQLMKIRYTDKVRIHTEVPDTYSDSKIPPLVLVTFVENAFKHGVSYQQDSFIDIRLEIDDGRMKFVCKNSKKTQTGDQKTEEKGGVGLANVKQRLDLLYNKTYTLDIQDNPETYEVLLLLPLNNDV